MVSVISRDLEFLKISSQGSSDLESRIKILEAELLNFAKNVKKELVFKSLAIASAFLFYILMLVWASNSEPRIYPTYAIIPADSMVQGNISGRIIIPADSVKISHAAPGTFEEWQMQVKLHVNKLELVKENISIKTALILTDENGVPVIDLKPGKLDKKDELKLKNSLINGNQKEE